MSVKVWNDCFGEIVGGHIDGQTQKDLPCHSNGSRFNVIPNKI